MGTRVALESFVGTQKMGVLKQMRRTFSKYLNYKKDEFDLILFLVRQLAQEKLNKNSQKYDTDSDIKIKESELVDKARHLGIRPKWNEFFRQEEILKKAG